MANNNNKGFDDGLDSYRSRGNASNNLRTTYRAQDEKAWRNIEKTLREAENAAILARKQELNDLRKKRDNETDASRRADQKKEIEKKTNELHAEELEFERNRIKRKEEFYESVSKSQKKRLEAMEKADKLEYAGLSFNDKKEYNKKLAEQSQKIIDDLTRANEAYDLELNLISTRMSEITAESGSGNLSVEDMEKLRAEEEHLVNRKGEVDAEKKNNNDSISKAESDLKEAEDRQKTLSSIEREHKYDLLPLKERLAKVYQDQIERAQKEKKIEEDYQKAMEAAAEQYGEEGSKDKESFDKARQSAKEEKDKATGELDKEYGEKSGKSKAGGMLAGIASSMQGVSDILDMVDLVSTAMEGNPIGLIVKIISSILGGIGKLKDSIDSGIEKYESLEEDYLALVNTRLMGLSADIGDNETIFDYLSNKLGDDFKTSYINQESLLKKLGELTEHGIAYNLEQRTILAELSDRMVSTFNILDDTLVRLTKLQQADMSVAELGSQASLTTFLNEYFQDNSYMNSMYSSISSALVEATSQMTAEDSVSFNYAVQKWLASLYSLGMSESGVTRIAEGVAKLATGDISGLESDSSLMTLFALSSGEKYTDYLLNGLNASNIDELLETIVTYLSSIGEDTNNVTRNIKSEIFGGMSLSDIRAANNLYSSGTVSSIMGSGYTWDESIDDLRTTLINNVKSNTSYSELFENLYDNFILNLGRDFVTTSKEVANAGELELKNTGWYARILGAITPGDLWEGGDPYATYKIGGLIGGNLGEAMQYAALGFNSNNMRSVTKSLKESFISLGNDLQGDMSGISLFFNDDFEDSLLKSRGTSYAYSTGVSVGTSISSSISSAITDATASATESAISYSDSLSQQAQKTEEASVTYESSEEIASTVEDIYTALFVERLPIRVILSDVETTAKTSLSDNQYIIKLLEEDRDTIINSIDDVTDSLNSSSQTTVPAKYASARL